MKLYICYGLFQSPRPGGHPCRNAHTALAQAGHKPELIRSYGWGVLPGIFNRTRGRREVHELTGSYAVPTLVLDNGTVINGSRQIVEWAEANPAAAQAGQAT